MIHASFVLGLSASIFFRVYCVKRWGGSPGKLICGLRVVKTSLQPVGWKEAWLRDSVWLAIAIVGQVVMIYAMNQITDSEFAQLGFMDRNRRIIELGGLPMQVVNWSTQLWGWGEFVVLLTNRERRALHDFIAGTIVVRK